MGLNNLTDKELHSIITRQGGLGEFLKDKHNLARVIGVDHTTRRRVADILKYEEGMGRDDIRRKIDEMAWVHSTVTDFF